ncbi:MAG: AsmA family protein [Alphaproteobacteria bacterium]|nr:AsmA family protein [Alphaproteobacteria bacterium]
MKKFFIFLAVLAIIVAGAGFALSRMISVERIENYAKTAVKQKTGRDLGIGGAHVFFWPSIGVRLTDVTLSNPAWAKEKNLVSLGKLEINLAARPLLDKRIEVRNFTLKNPIVHMEVSAKGQKSWEFTPEKVAQKPSGGAADGEKEGAAKGENGLPPGVSMTLGKFLIQGGQLTYDDAQKNAHYSAKNFSLAVTWPDLQSAFQMDGALDYANKRLNLFVSLDAPMELVNGKTSDGEIRVNTDQVTADITGKLATSGTLLDGKIDAGIESTGDFLKWVGAPQKGKLPFSKVSFNSKAQVTKTLMKLDDAKLVLDEIEAQGKLGVNIAGARPDVVARLSVNKLDLDRFTGGAVKPADDTGTAQPGGDAPSSQEWDATPINFSGLKALDADLVLNTQGFSLKGADVGPCTLTVLLKNGLLSFKSSQATFFGGNFTSDLTVDAQRAGAAPSMAFVFRMAGVQAKPVLTTFAHFKKLSGTTDANVSVTSSGVSQKEIIGNLAGNGDVDFKNGVLEGIDLANIARLIQSHVGETGAGEGKTEFVDMGGTFVMSHGVAANNDFRMRGPLVQASGAGTVDLPKKYLQYRVTPLLITSTTTDSTTGAATVSGLEVPVDIHGPFSHIKIKPDYGAVIKHALDNPDEIRATAKTIGKQGKEIFKDIKKDPGKALQNLLGNGGLFGRKPAPSAP